MKYRLLLSTVIALFSSASFAADQQFVLSIFVGNHELAQTTRAGQPMLMQLKEPYRLYECTPFQGELENRLSTELKDEVDFIVYPLSQSDETLKTYLAVTQVTVQPSKPEDLKVSDRCSLPMRDSTSASTRGVVELTTKKPYNFKLPDGTAARIVITPRNERP